MNAASDRDYAKVFALTFVLLAQTPHAVNRSIAARVWMMLMNTGLDPSLLDADTNLMLLGLAREEESEEGVFEIQYLMNDGTWE